MVLGPVWRVINPLRLLHARAAAARPRRPGHRSARPTAAGLWPAALGLFAFTWMELVAEEQTCLGFLRIAVLALRRDHPHGQHDLRPRLVRAGRPLRGVVSPARPLVAARATRRRTVGAAHAAARRQRAARPARARAHRRRSCSARTAYDGFSANLVVGDLRAVLGVPPALLKTATLLAFVGRRRRDAVARRRRVDLAGPPSPPSRSVGFVSDIAPSLIPIAGGYVVAHYWSLWVYQGQYLDAAVRPLRRGRRRARAPPG